jgi:hypothetical protein
LAVKQGEKGPPPFEAQGKQKAGAWETALGLRGLRPAL